MKPAMSWSEYARGEDGVRFRVERESMVRDSAGRMVAICPDSRTAMLVRLAMEYVANLDCYEDTVYEPKIPAREGQPVGVGAVG
jgi:hypothetical protein